MIPGKFYVCEMFKVIRGPASPEEDAMLCAHNLGASRMVKAGPFETAEDAETARAGMPGLDTHVYQIPA